MNFIVESLSLTKLYFIIDFQQNICYCYWSHRLGEATRM